MLHLCLGIFKINNHNKFNKILHLVAHYSVLGKLLFKIISPKTKMQQVSHCLDPEYQHLQGKIINNLKINLKDSLSVRELQVEAHYFHPIMLIIQQ